MVEKFSIQKEFNPNKLEQTSTELVSFWNVNNQERDVLKERIKSSQGEVLVFVHPYFNYEKTKLYTTETLVGLREGFKKLVSEPASKTPPILVLEERDNVQTLKDIIGQVQKQSVYYLPTLESKGRLFPEQQFPEEIQELHNLNEDTYHRKSFTFLSSKLKELGVSKIQLGGMFLDVYTPGGKTPASLKEGTSGCASDALVELAKKFPVTLSKLTHPDYDTFVKYFGQTVGPKSKFDKK